MTARLVHSTATLVQSDHHVRHATASAVGKTALLVIHVTRTSLVQPVLSEAQPLLGTRAMTAHLVVSKTVQHARSTETHAQRVMTAVHATTAQHASLKTAQRAPSTEQSAQRASLTTVHASSTATTATTAQTAAQIAQTALIVTAIVTAPSTVLARATQTRRPSLKTRSLSA